LEWTWSKIKSVLPSLIFASMLVGWGAKLLTFIYQSSQGFYHYFPVFPNIIDAIFMFVIALYLFWGKIRGMGNSDEIKTV